MIGIPQEEIDKLNGVSAGDSFEEETSEEEPIVETKEEVKKEEVSVSPEEDTVADKARVPYSRFETVNEAKIRAEERIKYLEEQLTSKAPDTKASVDLPEEWVELYGDSDAAKRAYQLQLSINQRFQEEAAEKVQERIEASKAEREEALQTNLQSIDDELNSLSEGLGRKITETEESAILDIQDEFTQKDKDGNYLVPLLPADKAFEIYTLRQEKAVSSKRNAKNRVLAVTGADSEGDVSNSSGVGYNPNNWGSWRDKLSE